MTCLINCECYLYHHKHATDATFFALSIGLNRTFVPPPVSSQVVQPRSSSQPPPGSKSVHFNPVISSSSSSPSDPRDPAGPVSPSYHHNHGSNSQKNPSSSSSSSSPSFSTNDSHDRDDDRDSSSRQNNHHHHPHRRHASQNDAMTMRSPSPTLSDTTVDLPPRFDQHGRRRPEKGDDPLADALEDMLSGKGPAGKLFNKFTGRAFLGHV